MSRRNVLELHQLLLSISVSLTLNLKEKTALFATAKVGQLITSKCVELRETQEGTYQTSSPLMLDLVVPYDRESAVYENKEIKIIITNRNKREVRATVTANLSDHINLHSRIEVSKEHYYRVRECEDVHGQAAIIIEYKQGHLKSSSASIGSSRSSLKVIHPLEPSNISLQSSSESILQESIVLQKSVIFDRHPLKENISPASPTPPCPPPKHLMSPEEKSIIQNLSIISNECSVLKSIMGGNVSLQALQEQNTFLTYTRDHMKNQIESLQYLNGVLLEEESNKEKEIQYLESQLDKAYKVIEKFKGSMELGMVEELRDEVNWLRQAREMADEELNRVKLENECLIEESRVVRENEEAGRGRERESERGKKGSVGVMGLKDEGAIELSLEFNKLKRSLLQKSQGEDKRRTLEQLIPLQRVIESLWNPVSH